MKIRFLFIIILLINLVFSNVYAYDYVNSNNRVSVETARDDVYSLKRMFDELAGEDDLDDEIDYDTVVEDKYWWPIGSKETTKEGDLLFAKDDPETVTISSKFGEKDDVSSHKDGHGGIDISGGKKGETNIIAAKNGTVVYPTDKDKVDCPDGKLGDTCGDGYGNYVIIQHSDGNYTLDAHLEANSITVKSGDNVKKGQVIGKMGTSGDSSGPHLHFEFRLGENTSSARVDPLDYVDPNNPRPAGMSGPAISMAREVIDHYEGVGCSGQLSEEGDNYIACAGGDGVITIGHGVTVDFGNTYAVMEKFKKYGYNSVQVGTRVPKAIVDKIEEEELDDNYGKAVNNCLSNAGIDDLKEYQVAALISRAYNGGPGRVCGSDYNFVDAYKKHNGKYKLEDMYSGNSSIWTDSMNMPINPAWARVGLQRRRVGEWVWFVTGEMDYLESGFDPSKYAW